MYLRFQTENVRRSEWRAVLPSLLQHSDPVTSAKPADHPALSSWHWQALQLLEGRTTGSWAGCASKRTSACLKHTISSTMSWRRPHSRRHQCPEPCETNASRATDAYLEWAAAGGGRAAPAGWLGGLGAAGTGGAAAVAAASAEAAAGRPAAAWPPAAAARNQAGTNRVRRPLPRDGHQSFVRGSGSRLPSRGQNTAALKRNEGVGGGPFPCRLPQKDSLPIKAVSPMVAKAWVFAGRMWTSRLWNL